MLKVAKTKQTDRRMKGRTDQEQPCEWEWCEGSVRQVELVLAVLDMYGLAHGGNSTHFEYECVLR